MGAIAPSSRFLARKMVDVVPWSEGEQIVEFGPGTGAFTGEILNRLPQRSEYLGIELDSSFVNTLKTRFPQAKFAHDSVARLREITEENQLPHVDHILSGLPFASLPEEVTQDVLAAMGEVLRPGGTFTTFQYLHAYSMSSAKTFRSKMEKVFGPLRAKKVEVRNIPPAYVFSWEKP